MINRRLYSFLLVLTLIIVGISILYQNATSDEKQALQKFYPQAKSIVLEKTVADNPFIGVNMPGVQRAYRIDGVLKAYVVSCVGYVGPIELLAALDDQSNRIIGIEILSHTETPDYASHIEEDWFLNRFSGIPSTIYLKRVVLDKENPEDVVQVTGASISSQAIVNAVNAAIGAYAYQNAGIEMAAVPDVVPQEMWQEDMNSFVIRWAGGERRINTDEIKSYPSLEQSVVLVNTTGTETKMHVKGTALREILKSEGIDLQDYAGIGVTGRDGYYTLIDQTLLSSNEVIVVWEVDGQAIKDEEKPVRIALPNALGPYWVKMVASIDLYSEITPKNITTVHLFKPLTQDITPYPYEYYGSKDDAIEIGKILKKFEIVDEKGFFTLTSVDGLVKNETISMVRQRYYIKVAGENAPMNIGPSFKLGMNVKHIASFSTTRDAVIFPEMMASVVRSKTIKGGEGLLLEDVLLMAGMRWLDTDGFVFYSESEEQYFVSADKLASCYLYTVEGDTALYEGDALVLDHVLKVQKQ